MNAVSERKRLSVWRILNHISDYAILASTRLRMTWVPPTVSNVGIKRLARTSLLPSELHQDQDTLLMASLVRHSLNSSVN
jgi:hypothetical protein